MDLIDLIREVRCTKGDDFICSEEFIEMLANMDSKEKIVFSHIEPTLVSLIRNGVMQDMLSWNEDNFMGNVDDCILFDIRCQHIPRLIDELLYYTMQMVGIGIGKVASMHTYRMSRAEKNAIKQGGEPDGDVRLEYISNGEENTLQGEVWLDTGIRVPKGSKMELWFADEVCDGPIAGYVCRKWPWTKEKRFELSLHKRRLYFNYLNNWEGNQTKVLRQNIYYSIAYNLKPSEHEQGIVNGFDCDRKPTVKLFRFADKYAWTGLKIFGFRVTDSNNVAIADMIPVMHRGKPCMYDKVRKKYFYLKEKKVIINPFK